MAFEAKAEDLETLGFISIITNLPFFGFTANWTFDPPVSTPISRKHAIDAFLITWYSLSVSVKAGATVIESPVWIPIGSRFSIEHTIMQLSFLSLTTSISYSFHPAIDSSINISFMGELWRPDFIISSNSFFVFAIPPPVPPKVSDGRIITGRPNFLSDLYESFTLLAISALGQSSPIFFMAL